MKIFISHPYKENPEKNFKQADKICKLLSKKEDVICISPLHLFSYYEDDSDRELIMESCYRLIDVCDLVLVFGDSSGCIKEKKYARLQGIPVLEVSFKGG